MGRNIFSGEMSPNLPNSTVVFILLAQRNLIKRKLVVSTLVHSRYRKSKENCKRLQQEKAKRHLYFFEVGKKIFQNHIGPLLYRVIRLKNYKNKRL